MLVCLNCGKLNPEGFNYCLECGAEIHPEKEHSAESNFLAGLSAESPEIKKLKEEIESQKANASQPRHGDSVIELTPEFDEPVIKAQISPNLTPKPQLKSSEPPVYASGDAEPSGDVIELEPIDIEDVPEVPTINMVDAPVEIVRNSFPVEPAVKEEALLQQPKILAKNDPLRFSDHATPQLQSKPKTPGCPSCGAPILASDKFCGNCGAPLTAAPIAEKVGRTMFMAPQDAAAVVKTFGKLVMLDPAGREGNRYNLLEKTTLGRESGEIVISDDQYINPLHCTFYVKDGKVFAHDEDSLNGVFVRITGDVPVYSGDIIRMGLQVLMYLAPDDFETIPEAASKDGTIFWGSPRDRIWGKLVRITSQRTAAEQYLLKGQFVTLGRERGDILFSTDGFVSGSHARITNNNNQIILSDLRSSNGTYVRVTKDTPLPSGSILVIGRKLFKVEIP